MVHDKLVKDGKASDIVIAVMGKTGAGRSYFINTLIGNPVMKVGDSLTPCTVNIEHVIAPDSPRVNGRRIVIVEPPGFNSDEDILGDTKIFRRIEAWLAASYNDSMKLAGIIYLQNIAEEKPEGPSGKLKRFRELCGSNVLRNVLLVTTTWTKETEAVGKRREQELKDTHWKQMITLGSRVMQFRGSQESAEKIVATIIESVKIREELAEFPRLIPKTDAGMQLQSSLEELLETMQKMADSCDPDLAKMLEQKLDQVREQMRNMKIRLSLIQRLKAFLGLGE